MLKILQFPFSPLQINTYLIIKEDNECIIIDPGAFTKEEKEFLLNQIKNMGLTPILLLQTHAHFDHVFATKLIVDTYNIIPKIHELEIPVIERVPQAMMMYNLQFDNYTGAYYYFKNDEKTIHFGDFEFEIIFTPGHSPGSVSYYCAAENIIFSGDVIFKNSIGRYDLPGANYDELMQSIESKIMTLPNETVIYNGHGESTTVEEERRDNPYLNKYL